MNMKHWKNTEGKNGSILSKTYPSAIPTTGNTTIHRELSIMPMRRRSNLGQN